MVLYGLGMILGSSQDINGQFSACNQTWLAGNFLYMKVLISYSEKIIRKNQCDIRVDTDIVPVHRLEILRWWFIPNDIHLAFRVTLRKSNMAVDVPPFMHDLPIETSVYRGFPIASHG